MRRHQGHRRAGPIERDGDFAERLCQVRQVQPLRQVLYHSGFGIRQLQGRYRRIGHSDTAIRVHRQIGRDPCADRVMFNRRAVNALPVQGKRRALGRRRHEHHIRPIRAQGRRDLSARPFDQRLGRATLGMDAGRVARHIHCRDHRLPRLGAQRRRGVMIQIGAGHLRLIHHGEQGRHRRTGGQIVFNHIRQAGLMQEDIDMGA